MPVRNIHVHVDVHIHVHVYMINTQTLEKHKAKTFKSNPKATTFQRKIAASGVHALSIT